MGSKFFIVEETDSYIVVKVFLMDMPFLRVHQFSLMCGRDRFSHTTIINLVVASMVEWVESTDFLSQDTTPQWMGAYLVYTCGSKSIFSACQ